MFTTVQNNHKLEVLNDYDFSSNNYSQEIKGDKGVEISGKLLESTAETFHQAREGNVTIHSAQVAKLLGSSDTKVNISEVAKLTDILKKLSKTTIHTGGGQSVKTLFGKLGDKPSEEEQSEDIEYIYYTKEGEFLGGKKDSKKIYLTTQTEYDKAKEKGKWSLINLEENLIKEKERIMPHSEFQDLAGTLYAESTADEFSFEEIISICCVLNNRATMDKTTILEKATQENQVYGWKDRGKIKSDLADSKRVKYCYKALIEVLKGCKDYSNGATYWHGKDFAETNKPAHKNFYLKGFLFTNKAHDKWKLGDKEVKGEYNKKTWKYKYKSTAVYANTTFMTLTKEWKEAVGYKKGKW
jgi:RHS repeat-associated core domain protein